MGYYVYKFEDMSGNVLYVGRTKHLDYRMNRQHFTKKGHLPRECYSSVYKIYTSELSNEIDMYLYELYLINKLKPVYNASFSNMRETKLILPDLEWCEYCRKTKTKTLTDAEYAYQIIKIMSRDSRPYFEKKEMVTLLGITPYKMRTLLTSSVFKEILSLNGVSYSYYFKLERKGTDSIKVCCTRCGSQIERTGGRQVYCTTCSEIEKRNKGRLRAQKFREKLRTA